MGSHCWTLSPSHHEAAAPSPVPVSPLGQPNILPEFLIPIPGKFIPSSSTLPSPRPQTCCPRISCPAPPHHTRPAPPHGCPYNPAGISCPAPPVCPAVGSGWSHRARCQPNYWRRGCGVGECAERFWEWGRVQAKLPL